MSQRIVLIGAEFACMWSDLSAARLLDEQGRAEVEITLVAPDPHLHIRPRLYEEGPAKFRAPLREIFDAVGVTFMQGTVEHIQVPRRNVEVVGDDGRRVPLDYDRLVLASGSQLFRLATPSLDAHTFSADQAEICTCTNCPCP
jgi:NADH:quinone reductase (non-electrogenic)